MKTHDNEKIIKNRVYYRVCNPIFGGTFPQIERIKCTDISCFNYYGLKNLATFDKFNKLNSDQVKASVFKNFNKAKDCYIKRIKKLQKEAVSILSKALDLKRGDVIHD